MRIELDITDATIQGARITDRSNPDKLEIVGYDYAVAEEDAEDETLDRDDAGTKRYVSAVELDITRSSG